MSNKNNLKKVNGILDLDNPQMAAMRATVVEQELSARSWKAYYEKMYFALESEKLEPLYKEYQERKQKQAEEDRAKMAKFIETLQGEGIDVKDESASGALKLVEAE